MDKILTPGEREIYDAMLHPANRSLYLHRSAKQHPTGRERTCRSLARELFDGIRKADDWEDWPI